MEDSREKGKALIDAIKEGNLEKVKHMIKNENVDVNWVDTIHNKNTPLHIAAYKNNVPIIDFLIKNEADINKQNKMGSTPLHKAALYDNFEAIETLLKNGADENAKDYHDDIPHSFLSNRNNVTTILLKNYNNMRTCFSMYGSLKCPMYTKEEADILKAQISGNEFLERVYRGFRNKSLASSAFNLSKSHKFNFLDWDTEDALLDSMIEEEYDSNIPLFKEEENSPFDYSPEEQAGESSFSTASSSSKSSSGGRRKSRKSYNKKGKSYNKKGKTYNKKGKSRKSRR